MAPSYKLIYFNARGRAEHIRFLFAYTGIDYEDERISPEKWAELKPKTPFGKLPVLEIDGQPMAQSYAIARYLARLHGLAGIDEWEGLQCDSLVDALEDLKRVLWQYRSEKDLIKKEEMKVKLMRETIPFYLAKFEKVLADNPSGYSVGENLTWTDFVFAVSLETFELIFGKNSLDVYPSLKALKYKIYSIPEISEWVAKRPVTES
nr:glutathione s-transferase sigma-2 [Protohermes costalis]